MLGRPGEECPTEDPRGNGPLYFHEGVDGSSVKIKPLGGMTRLLYGLIKAQEHLSLTKTCFTERTQKGGQSLRKFKALVEIREPNRHNLALIFIPRDGWPTCHNTHFFFRKMSGLTVSGLLCQVPEHRENLSKRTDVYSVLPRERERELHSSPGKDSQPVRTSDGLSAVRKKWEKHIRGHCAGAFRW